MTYKARVRLIPLFVAAFSDLYPLLIFPQVEDIATHSSYTKYNLPKGIFQLGRQSQPPEEVKLDLATAMLLPLCQNKMETTILFSYR